MASEDLKISPRLKGFVPLPSDPNVPLTPEQLHALFPNPEVWHEFMANTMRQNNVVGIADETSEQNVTDSDKV